MFAIATNSHSILLYRPTILTLSIYMDRISFHFSPLVHLLRPFFRHSSLLFSHCFCDVLTLNVLIIRIYRHERVKI